jgi:hypothetical protein
MANRREPAKAGRRLFQTIAHLVRTGIGTFHAVDPAKPAQPIARLRERDAHVPGTALRPGGVAITANASK